MGKTTAGLTLITAILITVTAGTMLADLARANLCQELSSVPQDSATRPSETINFTVCVPESFPATPMVVAYVSTVGVVGAGLLVHFKKRGRGQNP